MSDDEVIRAALVIAAQTPLTDLMLELGMTTTEGNDFRARCDDLLEREP